MPSHVPSDEADLASSDEVKVFHDEGECEGEERRSSSIGETDVTEEMNELKQRLIDEEERPPPPPPPPSSSSTTQQQSQGRNASTSNSTSRQSSSQSQATQQSNQPSVSSTASGSRQSPSTQIAALEASASSNSSHATASSSSLCSAFGYFNHPAFHPSNGSLTPGSKVPPLMMSPGPPLSFMVNMDSYPQPPPAHMGSHIDKVIPRPSLYPLGGPNQYPHVFSDLTQWHSPAMYQIPPSGFRGSVPYPASLSGPPPPPNFVRSFGQSLIPPYPSIGSHSGLSHHPALMKHSTTHDLMAAMAASVGLNQQSHLDSRTLHHHHHHHQSYGGAGGHNVSSVSPHLTSMLASSATLDQKPHHSIHHTSSLISRMSNGRGVSPSDHTSLRSNSSPPPSSECKSKISSNGALTINNNRIGHLNQNHSHNGSDTPDSILGTSHSGNSNNNNHHHHSNNSNNSSSSNHNGGGGGGGGNSTSSSNSSNNNNNNNNNPHGHIKKPLNAFMLYMKEQRPLVVQEFTLKESAQINQILGKKWHELAREEQQKYYEMAKKERADHQAKYPNWTARDNYAINQKKKKKKRDKSADGEPGSLKKCRARFGLQAQASWCKPCRRKKKCIRYSENSDQPGAERDNLGSVGSAEAQTPDSKSANESDVDNLNLSSAELSLSSPPVPNSDPHLSLLPLSHHRVISHHQSLAHHSHFLQRNSPSSASSSSSSLAALSGPPRNSPIGPNNPLSIEQLTRPHIRPVN